MLLPKGKEWYKNDQDFLNAKNQNSNENSIQMPGIAAFIATKENNATDNIKVYVGWKYKHCDTQQMQAPSNKPTDNDNITPLFEYSDLTHTERQLAICALYNAANQSTGNVVVEPTAIRQRSLCL